MGRPPRVYIEGILHYVTLKGGHNQNIFVTPSDYNEYISLIDKYKTQYGFKLFSFVLLPTHLYLLIELRNNVSISSIMRDIDSLYTKGFNSRHNRKGHLFQERFKTVLVEKEPYLLQLLRYMYLNSVRSIGFEEKKNKISNGVYLQKAKLVSNPKDYPYSSYSQFLEPEKRQYPDMREEIEEVFRVLGGREKAFEEYVTNRQEKAINEFRKTLRRKRILGSSGFAERIKKIIEEDTKARQKRKSLPRRKRIMLAAAAGIIIFVSTVTVGYFYRRSLILKSEYDKTAQLYLSTLQMLKRERDEALKAKKDIEGYQWKIKLTERALEGLQAEKRKALKAEKEIEGYAWNIKVKQIGSPKIDYTGSDIISFEDRYLASANMSKEGFGRSKYSKRELRNGNLVWETIQRSEGGETASWRGEWDGQRMRGVFSWRSSQGVARDFSFVSMGKRKKVK